MEHLEIIHDILTAGVDFESCRQKVKRFFDRTMLIRYDEILVPEEDSINGVEVNFSARLQDGIGANRKVLRGFLASLRAEGFVSIEDIQGLEKGYLSKILHTVAHLQDGFIGIDSRFYNLEEDSHGLSMNLKQKIARAPEKYWILKVKGRIATADADPFDALRTFEREGKDND